MRCGTPSGKFKDIQQYSRAHAMDIKRGSAAERRGRREKGRREKSCEENGPQDDEPDRAG